MQSKITKPWPFFKYSSLGNDFILIEGAPFDPSPSNWRGICHRRFGVGADGVLFLAPSKKHDFKMIYLNADGNEVGMCGNGARALVRHFLTLNPDKQRVIFETSQAVYRGSLHSSGLIALEMNEKFDQDIYELQDLDLPKEVKSASYLNTGVPHISLEWSGDLLAAPLLDFAPRLRHHPRFIGGVNINIFSHVQGHTYRMRTFERGVEDETLACGTGAMAVAHHLWKTNPSSEFILLAPGGELKASKKTDGFELIGGTEQVFSGLFQTTQTPIKF